MKNQPARDELLLKLGQAAGQAGAAASLVCVTSADGVLTYQLNRNKLRHVRQREGRYLLRTNLAADDPELIWRCYMQLVSVEEAFRTLKGDPGVRPVHHKTPRRIEAHLFIAFLAYCLSITLRPAGGRFDAAGRAGKICHPANARRERADDGWTRTAAGATHRV